MTNDKSDSFVRWQSVTREQLGAITNLVLGLATGMIAFESTLLLESKLVERCAFSFGIVSLALLVLSVGIALWCAINRLRDFRLTAQIARRRERGEVGQDLPGGLHGGRQDDGGARARRTTRLAGDRKSVV